MKRTWISEHGEGYAVPACITSALHDESWHNDACPHFCRKDDPMLVGGSLEDMPVLSLWVEHPAMEMRDSLGGARFLVIRNHEHPDVPEALLETDDAEEAVALILKQPIP